MGNSPIQIGANSYRDLKWLADQEKDYLKNNLSAFSGFSSFVPTCIDHLSFFFKFFVYL